ncbi:MAG: ATP-binding protein [Clostridiales bacterium]|nr:ATP-binding protein [Clostridiales bacterium]
MKLLSFCVFNFRSIENSGWIDCDSTTTLVGINESGKTNILKALWKFNPVRDGKIDVLHDMPVTKLNEYRNETDTIKFISVKFELNEDDIAELHEMTGINIQNMDYVIVSRFYNGKYVVEYPKNFDSHNAKVEGEKKTTLPNAIVNIMPGFVYYSNYGNLSSKIYLPHALKWIKGEKIQGIDTNEEQVRTLKVLFDFVNLDPEEIMMLGKEPKEIARGKNNNTTTVVVSESAIKQAENDKEKRSILLQSAGNYLTQEFKKWWNQGEYKFRFEADGDYFRIWVSDEIRPEEVALELRSTGLQWFLSFYLIFLMESQRENKNAILLLDEAGLTLHPLAQKDLIAFFKRLAINNQIINTTHSPFIIDTSNIDTCRVVYVDKNGHTVVSSDLRQGADKLNEKSIYAVHAALGLGVSDVLLNGCQTIIVEGPSDQYYLNAIKTFLIKTNLLTPAVEMVFMPSGGIRGISGIVSMVSGKTGDLPYVIIDADKSGNDAKKKLMSNLYKGNERKIVDIKEFTGMDNSEIEDIIPFQLQKRSINRLFIEVEEGYFEDYYQNNLPLVNQVEKYADENGINLPDGWKVEVAKDVKKQLGKLGEDDVDCEWVKKWKNLFLKLCE